MGGADDVLAANQGRPAPERYRFARPRVSQPDQPRELTEGGDLAADDPVRHAEAALALRQVPQVGVLVDRVVRGVHDGEGLLELH